MNPVELGDAAKAAAIRQWTIDPCGPETHAPPGSAASIEQLIAGRHRYCPWLADALDYGSTRDLDLLDVGCGQGIDVVQYALAGARVTGVDLTPRHVELARQHADALGVTARIIRGDAERLPFPDASFDRVHSNGVLHHTPNMPLALREARRVLRPGGEARIIVYNRRSYYYWLSLVLWVGIVQGLLWQEGSMAGVMSRTVEASSVAARPLVRVYSAGELRRMLLEAGFTDVTTAVGGFNAEDTPITDFLARHTRLFEDRRILRFLGRTGGWYLLGRGRRGQ